MTSAAPNSTTTPAPQATFDVRRWDNTILHSLDDKYIDPLKNINPNIFLCLQDLQLDDLVDEDLVDILPFLVKLLLNPYFTQKKQALKLLIKLKEANNVILSLQSKVPEAQNLNVSSLNPIDVYQFESGTCEDRIKIVALEYLRIQDIARQSNLTNTQAAKLQSSQLFDNPLYMNDVVVCLFVLLNKATNITVMNILDLSEALLHIRYGPSIIVRLVANMPERCYEVCHSLTVFGEKQDECEKVNEISDQRAKTLRALCQLSPSLQFSVRSLTLQMGKMPSLTVMITLDRLIKTLKIFEQVSDDQGDVVGVTLDLENTYDSAVSFITGILLGVDETTRTWFAQYIKSAQQKRIDQNHYTILSSFRSVLLTYMKKLFSCFLDPESPTEETVDSFRTDKRETLIRFFNRKLIQATATLKFYCALRGIGMLKLNQDESETLLRLVTCRHIANQTSINLATTGVCTLLVCSSMINNQKDEKRAAEWLKWLIKESHYSDESYADHGKCSISELLLLIAIHFQNNQTNQIAELVRSILGLKLQTKASVPKCKALFVQEVFTDQMIAEHAVRVPVTKDLDNTLQEFLPIHCIHQLLECRSFSKHQVPIKDWILKQICESKKPIHHMLPELIGAYVNSIIISTSAHGPCGTNEPIPEESIRRIFETKLYSLNLSQKSQHNKTSEVHRNSPGDKKKKRVKKEKEPDPSQESMDICENDTSNKDNAEDLKIVDIETAQVLLLYYLMLYDDVMLKKGAEMSALDKAKLSRYSPNLMMQIPVYYLLQLIRDNQDLFGTMLPPMIRLVAAQYPHLCSIQHWLHTAEHCEPYKSKDILCTSAGQVISTIASEASNLGETHSVCDIATQLEAGFAALEVEPLKLARTINHILMMPRDKIWSFVDLFMSSWTKILHIEQYDKPEQMKLVQLATKLWWKFNTIFPRKLWILTINSLRIVQNGVKLGSIRSLEYSWDDLVADPMIVLRCDILVFRSPDYLKILLHILTAFLAASRRSLQDQISAQANRQKDAARDRNLDELKTTLVLAQTSAAIQILLECCLPNELEEETLSKRVSDKELTSEEQTLLNRFDASVSCICEHLHQVFIEDTNLAKLVHFQSYPSELLATTCENIPSMHICLDFIPELLSQPDAAKQVFVIELTSHLCEKYAITKSLNMAKLCFNVAYTLLQFLPSDKRAQFYLPVLPALMRICKVFPILQEDARIILNQINQISLAHIASTSSRLSLSSASRSFEGLDKMSWHEVRKLMNSFSQNEALYICIQKCIHELDKMEEKDKQQLQSLMSHHGGGDKLQLSAYNTIFAYGSHVTNY